MAKIDPYQENYKLLGNPKVTAMLRTIRYAEGTDNAKGYNTRVGYSYFDDLSKKPGVAVYIPSIKDNSTAEGAYQFLNSTWEGLAKKLNLKDFSRTSQDVAAVELLRQSGALDLLLKGNVQQAVNKASRIWASLPTAEGGSQYKGQRAKGAKDVLGYFSRASGQPVQYEENTVTQQTTPDRFYQALPKMDNNLSNLETSEKINKFEEQNTLSEIQARVEQRKLQDIQRQQAFQLIAKAQPTYIEKDYITDPSQIEQQQEEFQKGGQVELEKDFKESKDFLKNWYTQREIQEPYINKVYGKEKSSFIRAVDNAPKPELKEVVRNNSQFLGLYSPTSKTMEIKSGDDYLKSTVFHETGHASQDIGRSKMIGIHKFLVDENIRPKENMSELYQKEYNYLTDPDEVHARVMNLRRIYDLKPKQEIKPSLIKYIRTVKPEDQDADVRDLLEMFDDAGLSNILNNMASVDSKPTLNNFAQKGGVIEDDKGQWKYPGEITKINSNNITMKGVDYPVIGVANTGEVKLMMPNQDYLYNNAKTVTEYPLKNVQKK